MKESFVLIPSKKICDGGQFREYRKFVKAQASGQDAEVINVWAFNCDKKEEIVDVLASLKFYYFFGAEFDERNFSNAVIVANCHATILSSPDGCNVTPLVRDILRGYGINVDVQSCFYIPVDQEAWGAAAFLIKEFMTAKR